MDPGDPYSFTHLTLELATGRRYHFVDELPDGYNPEKNPTILCIHGFPDFWAGWKHQIKPWVEKGYRVVAPDMLGYGKTDKPEDPKEYSLKKISDDLKSILDEIEVSKAFVIGHDWGSHIAGRFALWHPDRVLGVVHISIGFFKPLQSWKTLEETVEEKPIYKYQLYFADAECIGQLQVNLKKFFNYAFHSHIFSGPEGIPENFSDIIMRETDPKPEKGKFLLKNEELEYLLSQNDEIRGPTNYYRTWEIRHEEEKEGGLQETYQEGTPVLFLRGDQDKTSAIDVMENTKKLQGAEIKTYEGAAHWLMIEKREQVTEDVLDWLAKFRIS